MSTFKETIFIGVDPGKVTGVAIFCPADALPSDIPRFESHAYPSITDAGLRISQVIMCARMMNMSVFIGCERFTLGGKGVRTSQPDALEMIGVLKWFAYVHEIPLYITGAADAAAAASRETLTRLSWWIPGDRDQQRNKATAQVAHLTLRTYPDHWYDLVSADV